MANRPLKTLQFVLFCIFCG